MKNMLAVLILAFLVGCGPSAYQSAREDLNQQYKDLDTIQNMEVRKQKFLELKQKEDILEANHRAQLDRETKAAQKESTLDRWAREDRERREKGK
jgi:hypothetical protein